MTGGEYSDTGRRKGIWKGRSNTFKELKEGFMAGVYLPIKQKRGQAEKAKGISRKWVLFCFLMLVKNKASKNYRTEGT